MKKQIIKADFTAVVRDEYGTTVVKCKIIDEKNVMIQFKNITHAIITHCYESPVDYGILRYVDKKKNAADSMYRTTKDVDRMLLVNYYNTFMLNHLIKNYHKGDAENLTE